MTSSCPGCRAGGPGSPCVPPSAELPVGSRFGMGAVIINAAQYYNWQPANLWAAILVSALLGIAFYHAVAAVERRCVRWQPAAATS
jgi:ABC-type nitrate/sulfonate/bicarbonate transport system permease component